MSVGYSRQKHCQPAGFFVISCSYRFPPERPRIPSLLMKNYQSILPTFLLIFLFGLSPVIGDEIILKTGETLEGRITYEADDIVKIELQISSSIKETKIIARGDIEKIVKEAPDSVAFKAIKEKFPVGSL